MKRRSISGAMAAAAIAATAGVVVGVNVATRDLSVPPPPKVPAVALPADDETISAIAEEPQRPRLFVEPAADAPQAASAAPATAPPPPPAVPPAPLGRGPASPPAAPAVAAAAASQSDGESCDEPPGWSRAREEGERDDRAWSGPCSPGKGERRGWQRSGA